MKTTPDFNRIGEAIKTAPPIELSIDVSQAVQMVGLMQFALRHPAIPDELARTGRSVVNQIGSGLGQIDPEIKALVDAGWSADQDPTSPEEFDAAVAGDFNIVEVHNVYAVYELDEAGQPAEQGILEFFRPQDWGDPKRWHYGETTIRFDAPGPDGLTTRYVNHCHVWREVDEGIPEMFKRPAAALFMVMMPGTPREECDRSHLRQDDFWDESWGKMPPYYYPDDEGYEWDFLVAEAEEVEARRQAEAEEIAGQDPTNPHYEGDADVE